MSAAWLQAIFEYSVMTICLVFVILYILQNQTILSGACSQAEQGVKCWVGQRAEHC